MVISSGPSNPDFLHSSTFKTQKGFHLEVGARSIVGRRRDNQDCVGYLTDENGTLVLICCDGLGGHAHGELASSETVSFLAGEIFRMKLNKTKLAEQLMPLIHQAQKNLSQKDNRDTTLVMAVIFDDTVFMINVGDSWGVFQQEGAQVIQTEVQGMGSWVWKTLREHAPWDIEWKEISPRPDRPWKLCLVTDGCDEVSPDELFWDKTDAVAICQMATLRNSDNCSCLLVVATPPTVDSTQEAIPDGAVT